MSDSQDVHSLSDFQRNSQKYIQRLKESGQPEVLTVNGKPEIVVQDAASYKKIRELADRMQAIEGIKRGLEDVKAGRSRPAEEVFEDLRKKYEILD